MKEGRLGVEVGRRSIGDEEPIAKKLLMTWAYERFTRLAPEGRHSGGRFAVNVS